MCQAKLKKLSKLHKVAFLGGWTGTGQTTIADTICVCFLLHTHDANYNQAVYIIHLYYFGVIFWYRLFPVIPAWKEEQTGTDSTNEIPDILPLIFLRSTSLEIYSSTKHIIYHDKGIFMKFLMMKHIWKKCYIGCVGGCENGAALFFTKFVRRHTPMNFYLLKKTGDSNFQTNIMN